MNTSEYDAYVEGRWMKSTKEKPELEQLMVATLGLTGESGEVAEKMKKWVRGDYDLTARVRTEMMKELGDTQFYLSTLARLLGFDTESVMYMNIEKLTDRQKRTGTLRGDGDNR